MGKRQKITYLILGLGIGIVISSTFYSFFPVTKFVELSDDIIIEKARDLGMIKVKENIVDHIDKEQLDEDIFVEKTDESVEDGEESELSSEDMMIEKEEIEEIEEIEEKEDEYVDFYIRSGESSYNIARNLYNAGLIEDEKGFAILAQEEKVDKFLLTGRYKIKKSLDEKEVLRILTNRNLE